jgi:hypothetical protein
MNRVLSGTLLFLLLSGTTEASPTFYNRDAFVLFLFLVVSALTPDIRGKVVPSNGQPEDQVMVAKTGASA